jgi:hypothetical protein
LCNKRQHADFQKCHNALLNYYKINENKYICTYCNQICNSKFTDFIKQHDAHLHPFHEKKNILYKKLLNNICLYPNYCSSKEHDDCHEKMEKYYTFKNNDKIYYICPTCKNYFTDITYKQFYDVHYKHLHSFSIPKIEIFKMANKDNVIASSSNIKRKLSNELENINIPKKQLRLNENDYNDMETKYNFNKNHVTITFPIKSTININVNKKIQMTIDDEVNKLKYAKIQFGCFLTFANIENIENNTILSLSAKEYNDNFFNKIFEEINNKIEKFQHLSRD